MNPRILPVLVLVLACSSATPKPKAAEAPSSFTPTAVDVGMAATGGLATPLPVAITSFGAATDGQRLFVVGGYHGEVHKYSKEGQSAEVYTLDETGTWQTLRPMDEGAQGLAITAHGGALYRVGGMVARNEKGAPSDLVSVSTAARYDLASHTWTPLPALPKGRSSHAAAMVGDTLYVAGGWRLGENKGWADDVLALDVTDGQATWQSVPQPFSRRAVAVASLGHELYVVGGMDSNEGVSRDVDVFDTKTKTWRKGPAFPGQPFGVAACALGGALYASGKDGVVYRLQGDSWAKVSELLFPRFFHQLLPKNDGTITVLGGIAGRHAARTRVVEVLAPNAQGPQVSTLTLPNPGAAKNRQGSFLAHDTLFLFGGNNSLEQHDFEPENFLAEARALHLPSLKWRDIAPYPAPRQTMQTTWADDTGYSLGGFGHDGTTARAHTDVYSYDWTADEWTSRKAGLPARRTQFGTATWGGKLWVFGGLDYDDSRKKGDHFRHLASVLAAPVDSPLAKFEDVRRPMPSARRAFSSALLGDRYYVISGMREGFKLVDDAIAYDFKKRKWLKIGKPRKPRLSAELVALNDKLYMIGGSSPDGEDLSPDRSVEVYDPATDSWAVLLEELPFDTKHAQAFSFRGRVLIYTAHRDDQNVELVVLDPGKRHE